MTDIGEPGDQFEIEARIDRLNDFWGGKKLSAVNAQTCAGYVRHRGSRGGARRDLETFRAAINHHAKEGFHRGTVRVSLPPKGEARDRWLTRTEAAALIGNVGGIVKNRQSMLAARRATRYGQTADRCDTWPDLS